MILLLILNPINPRPNTILGKTRIFERYGFKN